MGKLSTFALVLAAVVSPALAIVKFPIARRDDAPANFLSRRHLQERATVTESLLNNQTLYMAAVSVGTPAQTLSIDIDTGSSDVYVLDKSADQCISASVQATYGGCFGGTFDSSKSSTFKDVSKGFTVKYGDKTGASGDFITDNFGIGGITIQNLIMGLATTTTTGSGLMGIGYDTLEASYQNGDLTKPYQSIIDTMMSQGLINTKSYSLYLDDLTAKTGSIIFGGADTQKFIGPLKVLPIVAEGGVYQEMLVTMTGISITNQTGVNTPLTNSAFSVSALLDSGTSLTYLPTAVYNEFATAFSATSQNGDLIVDCAYKNTQAHGYVSWAFGGSSGVTINVPIDEMIVSIPGNTQYCLLGVQEASKTVILGDVFLRSAYIVYDLTHNQIGLAQANFESSSSSLVEFKATDTGIPTLTGVSSGQTLEPGTSGKSAAAMLAPLDTGALIIFAISGLFSLLGGAWFLF